MTADQELRVVSAGHSFLESPRWHDGRLWVSDFDTHEISAITDDGTVTVVATMPGQPSGLGWLPNGDLIAVSMLDRMLLRLDSGGTWNVHADLSGFPGDHLNDMVVDAKGHAYVGAMGFNPWAADPVFRTSPVILVDVDGSAEIAADALFTPNGSAVTADGATLLVGETFGNRVSAFDIGADGRLGPRRDWARWGDPLVEGAPLHQPAVPGAVRPDGCAIDGDGGLWLADLAGPRLIRVEEGGTITDEIRCGEDDHIYAVEIGGPAGQTLYLTAGPPLPPAERLVRRGARVLSVTIERGRST